MKALLFLSFIFFGLSRISAQEVPETTNPEEISRWNVRIYPFDIITNIRTEIGYRFSEKWEANVLVAHYHHKYFVYRASTKEFHEPFYVPTVGNQLYVSIEKHLRNNLFTLGGRFGFRDITAEQFNVRPSFDSYALITPEQQKLDFLCIARYKSNLKGAFVEFTAQAGISYNMETEFVEETFGDLNVYYSYNETNYWFPSVAIGINVGFGW